MPRQKMNRTPLPTHTENLSRVRARVSLMQLLELLNEIQVWKIRLNLQRKPARAEVQHLPLHRPRAAAPVLRRAGPVAALRQGRARLRRHRGLRRVRAEPARGGAAPGRGDGVHVPLGRRGDAGGGGAGGGGEGEGAFGGGDDGGGGPGGGRRGGLAGGKDGGASGGGGSAGGGGRHNCESPAKRRLRPSPSPPPLYPTSNVASTYPNRGRKKNWIARPACTSVRLVGSLGSGMPWPANMK